jgi:uncharacterized protein (TIGR02246 family)
MIRGLIVAVAGVLMGAQSPDEMAIREVLRKQAEAWNRGDVTAFMDGYEESDETTFVGSTVTKGYRQVLENYRKRYPTPARMGRLEFSGLELKPLSGEYALVLGRWKLTRAQDAGGDTGGIFTLLFRKTATGWKIVLDHTS